jgi:hypothetical protein
MAKSNVKTQPAKPQVAPTGKVLEVQAPATAPATTVEAPASTDKAKRSSAWRGSLKAAGVTLTPESVIVFNEAAHAAKPKRGKSLLRIAFYKRGPDGMTVAEHNQCYVDAKLPKSFAPADRNWDYAHGFITVK